jgi:hypothetical protein
MPPLAEFTAKPGVVEAHDEHAVEVDSAPGPGPVEAALPAADTGHPDHRQDLVGKSDVVLFGYGVRKCGPDVAMAAQRRIDGCPVIGRVPAEERAELPGVPRFPRLAILHQPAVELLFVQGTPPVLMSATRRAGEDNPATTIARPPPGRAARVQR